MKKITIILIALNLIVAIILVILGSWMAIGNVALAVLFTILYVKEITKDTPEEMEGINKPGFVCYNLDPLRTECTKQCALCQDRQRFIDFNSPIKRK